MKTLRSILLATLALLGSGAALSQGFVNLDFEHATFVSDPTSGYYPWAVYASNAIPGWTPYARGFPQSDVLSNNIFISGGAVSIIGTNWVYPQIQGRYFVLLMGFNYPGFEYPVSLGQTGTVPQAARSLVFWGQVGLNDVSFAGQTLPLSVLSSTANYNIYGADISPFAGQTGELLFTTRGTAEIDNIQFLTASIPEPGTLALATLGAVGLGFTRQRKASGG